MFQQVLITMNYIWVIMKQISKIKIENNADEVLHILEKIPQIIKRFS